MQPGRPLHAGKDLLPKKAEPMGKKLAQSNCIVLIGSVTFSGKAKSRSIEIQKTTFV